MRSPLFLLLYILLCLVLIILVSWFFSLGNSYLLFPLLSILSLLVSIMLAVGITIFYLNLKWRTEMLSQGLKSITNNEWERWGSDNYRFKKTRDYALLGKVADLIRAKNEAISRQQSERMALLSSMAEGVVAVDNQENVLIVNRAAGELFNVDYANATSRMLHEVIRNIAVQKLVSRAFEEGSTVEGDVTVLAEKERKLMAHAAQLRDATGRQIGVIVVFNDITRLEQYENIRRDFVANVSHELKTPITTIKGFIETLSGQKPLDAADTKRFLKIIAEQADRMNAIVNDLLALTSIEHDEESAAVELTPAALKPVAEMAITSLETKARERNITLELQSPEDVTADINTALLEQALVNLLDNAIKYSEPGKTVRVEITADDQTVRIAVRDQGIGIDKRYIPRLTERFFRVDKSRSRKQGGTGLGLAIVKHIVKAHHGELSIESEPGVGSTFTLIVPASSATA